MDPPPEALERDPEYNADVRCVCGQFVGGGWGGKCLICIAEEDEMVREVRLGG